ncbi:MAG: peptidoglycan-binding domain-containing protein [Christensenellales bacterium]|nr:peptidoglycan-binding domain-containing protein [Christensenellales bacterium]
MRFLKGKHILSLALMLALLLGFVATAEPALVLQNSPLYAYSNNTLTPVTDLPSGTMVDLVAQQDDASMVMVDGTPFLMHSDTLGVIRNWNGMTAYAATATSLFQSFHTDSALLTTIPAGAAVRVAATAGNWAGVSYNGTLGFVDLRTLTTQAPAAPQPESTFQTFTAYAAVNNARVFNQNGKVVSTVPLNTSVTVCGIYNNLCLVERNGHYAVMLQEELSVTQVQPQPTETPANGITYITPTTFYVKNNGAKVYTSNGSVICTLPANTTLTVDAYTDTLARVSSGSAVGLMFIADLTDTPVVVPEPSAAPEDTPTDSGITEITPTTFYVQNNGAIVRDANGAVIATLGVNAAVTVNAYNSTLARVVSGSTVGFMLRSDLGSNQVVVHYTLKYGDTGEAVKRVQTRLKELEYFFGTVGGNYLELTQAAVSAFQYANGLTVTGECDETTLTVMFSSNAKKNPSTDVDPESGDYPNGSSAKPATGTAKTMDWWKSGIQSIFARGVTATVTDVSTGIAWRETRTGGTNHADVQPATAADTAAMKKAVGSWSWTRRAVFVTINGVNYAASINCMPHGSGSITSNNFDGHHCIHFTNSRTHGSNSVCSLHQAAIKKAASTTL